MTECRLEPQEEGRLEDGRGKEGEDGRRRRDAEGAGGEQEELEEMKHD
jgi:hypothetical protein